MSRKTYIQAIWSWIGTSSETVKTSYMTVKDTLGENKGSVLLSHILLTQEKQHLKIGGVLLCGQIIEYIPYIL